MEKFTNHWSKIQWENLSTKINNKNKIEVENALNSDYVTLDSMMALLSPAADSYLELMVKKAQFITRQRFGNTINFYIPLYLSNLCNNDCTYCGFSIKNRIKRKVLNSTEIIRECSNIYKMGFRHLLLVTGEHQKKVGIEYFRHHIPYIRRQFASLQAEIQPMSTDEYIELKKLGIDGIIVYQETYNKNDYSYYHLKGKKQDFFWRLETPDRIGKAGIDKIGLGVLSGLSSNWRVDNFIVAEHLCWLQKKYWKSSYSVSFPRLRPCYGGVKSNYIMSERQLLQTICAFRLLFPDVEISLSTRESPKFRDNVSPIAINNISAFSKTQPGGYSYDNKTAELEQFSPYDIRHPSEVAEQLIARGLQPVWKNWDNWSYIP